MTRRLPAVLSLALCLAACGGGDGASATPGASGSIVAALAARGFVATGVVGGDPGCDDPGLAGNALHLTGRLPPDRAVHDVYVYVFRSRAYEANRDAVDRCMLSIAERRPDVTTQRVDVPPYRAVGYWTREFEQILHEALAEAAAGGARALPGSVNRAPEVAPVMG